MSTCEIIRSVRIWSKKALSLILYLINDKSTQINVDKNVWCSYILHTLALDFKNVDFCLTTLFNYRKFNVKIVNHE